MKSTLSTPTRRTAVRSGAAVLAATAVVLLSAGCSGSSATAAAPSSASQPAPGHRGGQGIFGRVTTENGSTWTVVNPKGTQFTVDLTPQTAFGTAKAPATAQQFPVGSNVRVSGTRNGDTVTATRIDDMRAPGRGAAPSGAPAPTTTSST